MSLSNELSSEIATAILANANTKVKNLKELQEVVFRVHSTLRQMDDRTRSDRNQLNVPEKGATSSGNA